MMLEAKVYHKINHENFLEFIDVDINTHAWMEGRSY